MIIMELPFSETSSDFPAHIQEILDFEPDGLLLINQRKRIVLANRQAEQLFGYSRREILGMGLTELVPERLRKVHASHIANFFSHPVARPMGTKLALFARRKDGSEFPVDISLSPVKTAHQSLVACFIHDISEQKKVEVELREREQKYRALFEYANDAIFLLDMEGIHLQVNQKAADLLGYTREELVGMRIQDVVQEREYSDAQNRVQRLLKGESLPLYERTFRKKDSSLIPVEINISLVKDSGGEPMFFQSIVREITERKNNEREQQRLLEELRSSREELRSLSKRLEQVREEERSQLARELHDQVGQTLTGLTMNLQIVRHQLPPETAQVILRRLEDSAVLLNETTLLVRDVMSDLRPPMLDDYGLVSAVKWYCHNFSLRTGINIQVYGKELQPRLPEYAEIILFRIIQEALNNIAKYAGVNQADLHIEDHPDRACISISDQGTGFNLEEVNSPERKPHWGLLNMEERARSIGGLFTITTAPGKGTRIAVEIEKGGVYR
jgi:PAS domain S-box-containing protein